MKPNEIELFEAAIVSPELDRIQGNIVRHKMAGRYDRERTLRSIGRFVVEPEAIRLAGGAGRWWELYPEAVRTEVAERILRCEEREAANQP